MKPTQKTKLILKSAWLLFLVPIGIQAQSQCEIFKSEISNVETHMNQVTQIVDSLRTKAETAAFGAQLKIVRSNAKRIEILIGKALSSADEAVTRVGDSQYYSESCALDDVISYTIDAESNTIDARDFLDEAYNNAKKANTARTLGDIQYYMRKYQTASKMAKNSAEDAAYAAAIAHASCTHTDDLAIHGER
ncbi:hypothetical protein [Maribacter sp. 2210JD10-5]|uniref:hypothetical protein n=1 Tax=Maribacter sp. 2210JD10-5 TaxID=3386272 RepID=UPI0039BD06C1